MGLQENLFTDRSAGLRFDETYLSAEAGLLEESSWSLRVEAGAVRRGRGIFGEGTQNFIHDLLGEPEVHLTYAPGSTLHPFLELELARDVALGTRFALRPSVELQSAGFKESARAQLGATWELPQGFRLAAAVGWRESDTEYVPLVPWLAESAATWELGLGFRDRVSLHWTENAYGTKDRHLHLRVRFPFGG